MRKVWRALIGVIKAAADWTRLLANRLWLRGLALGALVSAAASRYIKQPLFWAMWTAAGLAYLTYMAAVLPAIARARHAVGSISAAIVRLVGIVRPHVARLLLSVKAALVSAGMSAKAVAVSVRVRAVGAWFTSKAMFLRVRVSVRASWDRACEVGRSARLRAVLVWREVRLRAWLRWQTVRSLWRKQTQTEKHTRKHTGASPLPAVREGGSSLSPLHGEAQANGAHQTENTEHSSLQSGQRVQPRHSRKQRGRKH